MSTSKESLRCDITYTSQRRVEKERKVGWVVLWEISRFETRKIGEVRPIPGRDENVFSLDISVVNLKPILV